MLSYYPKDIFKGNFDTGRLVFEPKRPEMLFNPLKYNTFSISIQVISGDFNTKITFWKGEYSFMVSPCRGWWRVLSGVGIFDRNSSMPF
jgi:hypothetical protein